MHYHCNQNRQSIGVSSDSMHTTAALLQIHTQINSLLLHTHDGKKQVPKLKEGGRQQHLVSSYHNNGNCSSKANATTHERVKRKKQKKTFRGSDIWEQFKVSKLSLSTSHFKVCKNTFHLYQHTGCISSAFLLFYIFFAEWDTQWLPLAVSPFEADDNTSSSSVLGHTHHFPHINPYHLAFH